MALAGLPICANFDGWVSLLQVSWDWSLDSTIVFKAVNYLDHYLSTRPVEVLARWAMNILPPKEPSLTLRRVPRRYPANPKPPSAAITAVLVPYLREGGRRFQLVGIACLRAAMGDTKEKEPKEAAENKTSLDAARFAYISDRTYSAAEVEEVTEVVQASTPACMRAAPNAKMFLRSFWYRSATTDVLTHDEMHIYTVARHAPCLEPRAKSRCCAVV